MALLKRSDKEQMVAELANVLREARAVVVASFRTLPVTESFALRRALRTSGSRLQIVPKRLLRRVAENLGWPAVLAETPDSIAVAWSADFVPPAKNVHAFMRGSNGAAFLGGVLEGSVLSAGEVEKIATLPPLATVRAQLATVLAGPVRGFLGVATSILRGLPAVLYARAQI